MEKYATLAGRIMISLIFLVSGTGKIFSFEGTQGYMASHGMPMTAILLVGAILLEIGGGLSVLLGYKTRLGALTLMIFLVPATLIFHSNVSERIQMIMFLKNVAIMGGLLFVWGFGPGPISLDERKRG